MKNLPEKIYISRDAHYDPNDWSIGYHKKQNSCQVEYVRKDVAEQTAKEFAEFMIGREYILWEDGTWLGHNDDNTRFRVDIDELFTGFINK